jgi:carboxyl-terminal processing protease
MEDGLIKVVAPIDETPAAKAGVMANDIITHLDDEAVQGLTLNQAVDKMRGPVNTKIKLKIVRKGAESRSILRSPAMSSGCARCARSERRRWFYIRVLVQRADHQDLRKAINLTAQTGDKLKGFVSRPAQQSGRIARSGDPVSDAFLERGEIVSTRRPQRRGDAALQRPCC